MASFWDSVFSGFIDLGMGVFAGATGEVSVPPSRWGRFGRFLGGIPGAVGRGATRFVRAGEWLARPGVATDFFAGAFTRFGRAMIRPATPSLWNAYQSWAPSALATGLFWGGALLAGAVPAAVRVINRGNFGTVRYVGPMPQLLYDYVENQGFPRGYDLGATGDLPLALRRRAAVR